jgi:divalent metal cation (Fe/Co/Zn/Cd) transporter
LDATSFGLCFALVAVGFSMITGNPIYDALGSIVIGFLLVLIAVFIGIEIQGLLIGQGVEPDVKADMKMFLEQRHEIQQVFNLLTLQLGSDVMVAVKARMEGFASAEELVSAINQCEKAFKHAYPQVLWLFFEPDIGD